MFDRRRIIRFALLIACVACAPAIAAPASPSASDIVAGVQKFYANIQHVTAKFRQTVTYDVSGSTKDSDGAVWIAKPGKMRWDYYEKKKTGDNKYETWTKKSFISNGTNLYVVEHDNKQVIKKNLSQDMMPVAVTFLYGKGDLSAEFNPEMDTSGKWGGKDDIVLKLTPKKPTAQYKTLFLVVSPKDYHVTQSIIVDAGNNVNHFRFFEPDFEKAVDSNWFEFNPSTVKDYRIVDGDAGAGSGSATKL